MKKLVLICILLLVVSVGGVSARCVGPIVNGKCLGTEVYGSDEPAPQKNVSGKGNLPGNSNNRTVHNNKPKKFKSKNKGMGTFGPGDSGPQKRRRQSA